MSRKKHPWWWLGQRAPIARFTAYLALWTAFLFAATVINAIILFVTDQTLRDTLEANNRAWLAVTVASLDNMPAEGLPLLGHVTYKNTGHSPAMDMNYVMFIQILPVEKSDIGESCNLLPPKSRDLTLFPGNEMSTIFPYSREAVVSKDVIDGKLILYWRGCFRYKTYGKNRTTDFCYFLRHNGPTWSFQDCGTKAD